MSSTQIAGTPAPGAGAARTGTARSASRPLPWLVGGLGAAAVVAAGGWLLVLAPQAQASADLQAQALQAESTQALLTARVSQLQQQFSDLPQYQAQLAAIEAQMPQDAALPDLVRAVRDAAATSGVQLTGLVPSAPVTAGAAAATTTVTADATGSAAPVAQAAPAADAADAAQAATGTTSALVQVPVSITATGSYASLQLFLGALQQQQRLVLVTSAGLAPSTSTTSATAGAELALTVSGSVFALGDAAGTTGVGSTGSTGSTGSVTGTAPVTTDTAPIS